MNIEDELIQFIQSVILTDAKKLDFSEEDDLISSGHVDSMGLLQILGFIDQKFGVDLMAAGGGPEDFSSVAGLAAAIRRNQSDQ